MQKRNNGGITVLFPFLPVGVKKVEDKLKRIKHIGEYQSTITHEKTEFLSNEIMAATIGQLRFSIQWKCFQIIMPAA